MQRDVTGDDVGRVDGALTAPVGESPAGFLDDRDEGGDIPSVDAVIDHDIDRPLSHESEAVKVSEASLTFGGVAELREALKVAGSAEPVDARIAEVGLIEREGIRDEDLAVVAIRAIAAKGAPEIAESGCVGDPGDGVVLIFEAKQRTPDGDIADKGTGAIDGIDHPAETARAGFIGVFFTEESIAGEVFFDGRADQFLRLFIRHRHRALIGFPLDFEPFIEVFLRQIACFSGHVDGQIVPISPVRVHANRFPTV